MTEKGAKRGARKANKRASSKRPTSTRPAPRKGSGPGKRTTKRSTRRASGGRPWLRWLLALGFAGVAAGVLAVTMVLAYYGRNLPRVDTVRDYAPPQITRIVDRHGTLLHEMFEERRTVVPMERIPRVLVLSVLAAEDADFYRHEGLDYTGILRALVYDIVSGSARQGASTITQQIVKNLLLSPERTIARKIRELILARRLEQALSKDEILWLYLNHINFGHGRYGVQEASRFYFDKDVDDLSLAEASLIAGIPQAPARLSPFSHPEAAKKRQAYVLRQLAAKRSQYWDDLSAEAITAAQSTEVKLAARDASDPGAPEVVSLARKLLDELVGEDDAERGGFRIETSIDLELQRAARKALRRGLRDFDDRKRRTGPLHVPKRPRKLEQVGQLRPGRTYDAEVTGTEGDDTILLDVGGHAAVASLADVERYNPKGLSVAKFARTGARTKVSLLRDVRDGEPARVRLELGPQGAVVLIDPRSRQVLAMVGGDEPGFGFNRALQAVRQPGSTFKPIAYALALESRKYTPATLVLDAPEVYDKWRPGNYETWHYEGAVPLRTALAKSINLVAVRVVSDLTPQKVADFGRALGLTTPLEPNLSISLGASAVRPIELVNAYATFAAGGLYSPYRVVTRITRADGSEVPLPDGDEARKQVLSPAAAHLITSMLQSVVQEGTGRRARKLERAVAGKTGTSNLARDAWFVGFTPNLVAGVWVGYDDHRPLGKGEGGGRTALPIWIEAVEAAVGDDRKHEFAVPAGIVTVEIDPKSGLLAYEGQPDAIEERFIAGTEPTERAAPPDVLDSTSFMLEQLQGLGGTAPAQPNTGEPTPQQHAPEPPAPPAPGM